MNFTIKIRIQIVLHSIADKYLMRRLSLHGNTPQCSFYLILVEYRNILQNLRLDKLSTILLYHILF